MTPGGMDLTVSGAVHIYINIYICESSNVLTNEHSFFSPVIYSFLSVGKQYMLYFFFH